MAEDHNPPVKQDGKRKSLMYLEYAKLWKIKCLRDNYRILQTISLARLGDWTTCQFWSFLVQDLGFRASRFSFNHSFWGTKTGVFAIQYSGRLGHQLWKLDAIRRTMGCHFCKMHIDDITWYKEKQNCRADSQDCWFASHPFCFKAIFNNPMFKYV